MFTDRDRAPALPGWTGAVAVGMIAMLVAACGSAAPAPSATASATASATGSAPAVTVVLGAVEADAALQVRTLPLEAGAQVRSVATIPAAILLDAHAPRAMAATSDGKLKLIDLVTGAVTDEPVAAGLQISPQAKFSPDGTKFVYATTVNAQAAPVLHVLDFTTHKVTDLAIAPEALGDPVAWTASGILCFAQTELARIDPATGKTVATIQVPAVSLGGQFAMTTDTIAVVSHTSGIGDDNTDTTAEPTRNTLNIIGSGGANTIVRTRPDHNMTPMAVAPDGTTLVDDAPAGGSAAPAAGADDGFLLVHRDGSTVQLAPFLPTQALVAGAITAGGGPLIVVGDHITSATTQADPIAERLLLFKAGGGVPITLAGFTSTPKLRLVLGT